MRGGPKSNIGVLNIIHFEEEVNSVFDKLYVTIPNLLAGIAQQEAWERWNEDEWAKADRGTSAMFRRDGSTESKTPIYKLLNGSAAIQHKSNGQLLPDREQLAAFIKTLFKHATSGNWVSLRAFPDKGSGNNKAFEIKAVKLNGDLDTLIDKAYSCAERAAKSGDKIVFCPPVATFTNKDHAREEDLAEGLVLSIECDEHAQEACSKLQELLGSPTAVVKSGGEWINPETGELEPKLHDYYRLKIPARDPETLKKLKQARELATEIVGGDASNVSAVHPIRWPGSLHRKAEPKLCRIMTINPDAEIDLDQALDILRKARPHSGNGYDADYNPYDRYEVEERLDLDQLLDDMVFKGTGNGGNVNTTELRYCSSQLSRGMSVDEVIETLRNEILNRIPESHGWNWGEEIKTLRRMCTDWLRKHPELEETAYPPPESDPVDQAKPDTRQTPAVALFDPWAQFIVPTFPLEVLPPSLLTYVIAQAEVIGVDVSSMAMTVLAACSSALSHCFALKMMRHGNWYVSPRLWVLLFGDSSKKKTPTILAATKPLKDYQDETWAEYEREKTMPPSWIKIHRHRRYATSFMIQRLRSWQIF